MAGAVIDRDAYCFAVFGRAKGPWRETREQAEADALDAGLATVDDHRPNLVWLTVPAEIWVTHDDVPVRPCTTTWKKGPTSPATLSRINRIIARREARKSATF